MQIDLNRFRAAFFEEASEHLQNMEASLLQLETQGSDHELLNTIFRAAHSIKGASATFGIDSVAKFTHVLENLLDRMREGTILPNSELCELLLKSTDVLSGLIQSEQTQCDPPEQTGDILRRLEAYSPETHSKAPAVARSDSSAARTFEIRFRPSRDFFHSGQNPLLLLDEVRSLCTSFEVTADTSEIPPITELDPESCYVSWTIIVQTERSIDALRDVFMFVDDASQPAISETGAAAKDTGPVPSPIPAASVSAPAAASGTSATTSPASAPPTERRSGEDRRTEQVSRETVRVDRERLDKMINQIGELVIGTSMVEQDWSRFHPDMESSALVQLGKIVRDLQEMSLSLRMVPIAATFQKMTRIVRDLSHRLGRQVRLEMEGEDTELDKTVVDQIGDPLLHMVRNSVDHGIESPEERVAAGKSPEGRICLKAYHQGGNFIIEIEDDGRGLDRDRILRKAIERGLVAESETLSEDQIFALIFAPGFSTAEAVTDISGRGVGMDVVRRNVEALQGSISVRSVKGQGCRVIVRLPLTLAILDGLLVRVATESYVIPLLSVVESIKPGSSDVRSVLGRGEVISLRGEIVPLLRLDSMLSLRMAGTKHQESLLVIVEDQGRKYSLAVDELLGQQQVVIKNLETNFQKVPGVAGATILGDGRVALILDINGLCSMTLRSSPVPAASAATV
ncbi:MAG: chemotaxis protein CheA [Planctomycetaceae bacterium]